MACLGSKNGFPHRGSEALASYDESNRQIHRTLRLHILHLLHLGKYLSASLVRMYVDRDYGLGRLRFSILFRTALELASSREPMVEDVWAL